MLKIYLIKAHCLRGKRQIMTHVKGKNKGKVMLYALSTCIWCKKTKKFLNELGVEYDYEDVDLLEGEEEKKMEAEINKWRNNPSFPLIVINDKKVICGYEEEEIRKALEK